MWHCFHMVYIFQILNFSSFSDCSKWPNLKSFQSTTAISLPSRKFNPYFLCDEICSLFLLSLPSAGSRSGSPGRVLTTTTLSTLNTGVQRVLVSPATAQKRSKIPRSQGCSREASPSRLSVGKACKVLVGSVKPFKHCHTYNLVLYA